MAGPLVSVSLLMTRGHLIAHWAVLGTEWPGPGEHLSWPCGILAAGVQGPRSRPPQCCEASQWQEPFHTANVETRLQFVHLLEQSRLCATHAPCDPCSSNGGNSVAPRATLMLHPGHRCRGHLQAARAVPCLPAPTPQVLAGEPSAPGSHTHTEDF